MMLAWIDVEARTPLDHQLRPIKKFADDAFRALADALDRMYAQVAAIDPARASAQWPHEER